jgi:hypothetical protein
MDETFVLTELPFWPVFVRGHFTDLGGAGAGRADVTFAVTSGVHARYDTQLFVVEQRGLGRDLNFRLPKEERDEWLLQGGDGLRVTWTNPYPGVLEWGLEVELEYADIAVQ